MIGLAGRAGGLQDVQRKRGEWEGVERGGNEDTRLKGGREGSERLCMEECDIVQCGRWDRVIAPAGVEEENQGEREREEREERREREISNHGSGAS